MLRNFTLRLIHPAASLIFRIQPEHVAYANKISRGSVPFCLSVLTQFRCWQVNGAPKKETASIHISLQLHSLSISHISLFYSNHQRKKSTHHIKFVFHQQHRLRGTRNIWFVIGENDLHQTLMPFFTLWSCESVATHKLTRQIKHKIQKYKFNILNF